MLHEELPQVFAVFTVVFELGVMFAEMLGDCFIASRFICSLEKIAPKDRIKAADAAVKRAKDTPL